VSFDLGFAINGDEPVETQITLDGPTTVSGYRFSRGWAKDQRVCFVARFSTPFQTWLVGDPDGYSGERREVQATRARGLFRFVLRPGQPLGEGGLSPERGWRPPTSNATPGWEFDGHRKDAARVGGSCRVGSRRRTRHATRSFTALYHALRRDHVPTPTAATAVERPGQPPCQNTVFSPGTRSGPCIR
jgi:hypothetical protein